MGVNLPFVLLGFVCFASIFVFVMKQTKRCLVINQTLFCIVGSTKKLNLKRSFCVAVLHIFLTEFRKILFVFAFQKRF